MKNEATKLKVVMVMGATILGAGLVTRGGGQRKEEHPFFETRVIVARDSPFRRNAYPTVATLPDGRLFLVWAGSNSEDGSPKDKMRILGSFSSDGGRTWSEPEEVINTPGFRDGDPNIVLAKNEIQVYSTTVPFRSVPAAQRKSPLRSQTWKATRKLNSSKWSKPEMLPPIKKYVVGKIHAGVSLEDGTLLMPYAWDILAEEDIVYLGEGGMRLKSGVLISRDQGTTWTPSEDIYAEPPRTSDFGTGGVCEPSIAVLENGEIFMLLRTADVWHYETHSRDQGRTWSTPVPSPLQGHNTPAALWRLRSRPDVMVVWDNAPRNRWPLDVALSTDNAKTWSKPKTLANPGRQASYPTSTELPDGTLIVIWQQDPADGKGRNIHIARFNRAWLFE